MNELENALTNYDKETIEQALERVKDREEVREILKKESPSVEDVWVIDNHIERKKRHLMQDIFELGEFLSFMKEDNNFRQLDSDGRDDMLWGEYLDMKGLPSSTAYLAIRIVENILQPRDYPEDMTREQLKQAPQENLDIIARNKEKLEEEETEDDDPHNNMLEKAWEQIQSPKRAFSEKFGWRGDREKEEEYLLIDLSRREATLMEGDPSKWEGKYDICIKAKGFLWGKDAAHKTEAIDY